MSATSGPGMAQRRSGRPAGHQLDPPEQDPCGGVQQGSDGRGSQPGERTGGHPPHHHQPRCGDREHVRRHRGDRKGPERAEQQRGHAELGGERHPDGLGQPPWPRKRPSDRIGGHGDRRDRSDRELEPERPDEQRVDEEQPGDGQRQHPEAGLGTSDGGGRRGEGRHRRGPRDGGLEAREEGEATDQREGQPEAGPEPQATGERTGQGEHERDVLPGDREEVDQAGALEVVGQVGGLVPVVTHDQAGEQGCPTLAQVLGASVQRPPVAVRRAGRQARGRARSTTGGPSADRRGGGTGSTRSGRPGAPASPAPRGAPPPAAARARSPRDRTPGGARDGGRRGPRPRRGPPRPRGRSAGSASSRPTGARRRRGRPVRWPPARSRAARRRGRAPPAVGRRAHQPRGAQPPRTAPRSDEARRPRRPARDPPPRRRARRPQTVTRGRSSSSLAGPMPRTSSSWSTDVKRPISARWATIAFAVAGPTPGSASRAASSAVLRSTGPAAPPSPSPAPAARRRRAAPRRPRARRRASRRPRGRPG